MSYNKELQDYRYKKGISYQQVEEATQIPAHKIKHFELGKDHLTLKELETLLFFYDLTWEDLDQSAKPDKKNIPTKFMISLSILIPFIIIVFYFQDQLTQWRLIQKASLVYSEETNHQSSQKIESDNPASAISVPNDEPAKMTNSTTETDRTAMTLRFWGNIQYNIDSLPSVPGHMKTDRMVEIFPVEQVQHTENPPGWLKDKDRARVLLNGGTADVKTETTLQEYLSWKERGYASIGLNKVPDVYQPFILEAGDTKIAIVSLARVVHSIHDVASKYQVGLPKAYDRSLIKETIQKAKQQSDLLIVLTDWGKTWGMEPESYQKHMAADMISAGGDLIVGNHPFVSQHMEFVQDKPLFHSLGHSVSRFKDQTTYNYLLDVDIQNGNIKEMRVIVGKMVNGALRFDLTNEDKKKIAQTAATRFPSDPRVKLIY